MKTYYRKEDFYEELDENFMQGQDTFTGITDNIKKLYERVVQNYIPFPEWLIKNFCYEPEHIALIETPYHTILWYRGNEDVAVMDHGTILNGVDEIAEVLGFGYDGSEE